MLQVADAWFAYDADTPVLRGVSIAVPAGGFVGILGPNGSGKTTLLRLMAGARRPARGRVTLDGVDLASMPRAAIAQRMAVVPQETHLAFDYTVLEMVLMGRYPHLGAFEVEGPDDIAIARRSLDATGTLAFEDRLFSTLSGGEKQRVVIAAALAQIDSRRHAGGGLLLLDEPTAALDLGYQLEVAALLRDLQRRTPPSAAASPLSIVISTHDLNFAASLCTTVVLLQHGQVLAAGALDEVLTPARIRELYGVEAEVERRAATGHLVVLPVGRSATKGPA